MPREKGFSHGYSAVLNTTTYDKQQNKVAWAHIAITLVGIITCQNFEQDCSRFISLPTLHQSAKLLQRKDTKRNHILSKGKAYFSEAPYIYHISQPFSGKWELITQGTKENIQTVNSIIRKKHWKFLLLKSNKMEEACSTHCKKKNAECFIQPTIIIKNT